MAFDTTLPTNSTKIRNYPTVLTDNFSAIEQGDLSLAYWQINFIERNAVPGAPPPTVDPTRQDDTMIVFSKQDGAGETELFILNDRNPAKQIQITEDGKMGSTGTPLLLDSFSFDDTSIYKDNNIISAWSFTDSNATQTGSFGMTVAGDGTGKYVYTFAEDMKKLTYCVIVTPRSSGGGGNPVIGMEDSGFLRTVKKFRVVFVNQNNTPVNIQHNVMVIGGRIL